MQLVLGAFESRRTVFTEMNLIGFKHLRVHTDVLKTYKSSRVDSITVVRFRLSTNQCVLMTPRLTVEEGGGGGGGEPGDKATL